MGIIGSGFNKVGGTGDRLRQVAASFMSAGGNDEGANNLRRLMQEREQEEQLQQYRQAQVARDDRPEVINMGGGGVATFNRNNNAFDVIREPTAPIAQSSENERLLDRWKALPDGNPEKALIERTLRGYQYSQPVIDAKHNATLSEIGARGGISLRNKQAPTYSNLHPKAPSRAAPRPPAGFILD